MSRTTSGPPMKNLFDTAGAAPAEETVDRLLRSGAVTVERIVSTGQTTPPGAWYDQAWEEWVAVIQGEALLVFGDGTTRRLVTGDSVVLPPHHRHRVEFTTASPPCIWLAVHVGREE